MKLLFVNACLTQHEPSRTETICESFLQRARATEPSLQLETVMINGMLPLGAEQMRLREALMGTRQFSHPLLRSARQFLEADHVLVGAPCWDMSFPAALRAYIEHVMVPNYTFHYTENGEEGLCRAKTLTYVTTMGGALAQNEFGVAYWRAMTRRLGIGSFQSIVAENLDMQGCDIEQVMRAAIRQAEQLGEDLSK